ncbi:CHASE3 domain-containing protein [Paenibacillus whitsoniae]|uniref:Circadian input-output histidine kinase CikA n=1 Tax=Paenibacillus whitsoniae TaxID=2496558 RepID=A0A3S0IDR4_9BACL|nr:CHASE3 domain-containing protein [Paenibacillus whitsoniae]RTE10683.1 response regulator [Paenibacillus whitsoniae]
MFQPIRFTVRTKILAGYLFILLCLGLSLITISGRISTLQKEVDFVSGHDIDVHDLLNLVQKNMLEMETSVRGYIITGDEQYLEPYDLGSRTWLDNYNKLYQLLEDNPEQLRGLEQTRPVFRNWIASSDNAIRFKKDNQTAALNEYFKQNTGKKLMDQLRTQMDTMLQLEKQLTTARTRQLEQSNYNLRIAIFVLVGLAAVISVAIGLVLSSTIVKTIRQVTRAIEDIRKSDGQLTTRIHVNTKDEIWELAEATNRLLDTFSKKSWIEKSVTDVSFMYQGLTDLTSLAQAFIGKLGRLLDATYGVIYFRTMENGETLFSKTAAYAASGKAESAVSFRMGEGLVGQCAADQRMFLLDNLSDGHVRVVSGLGESAPTHLLVAPIMADGRVEAVVELAGMKPFLSQHLELLDRLQDKFSSVMDSVLDHMEIERLLGESQVMTEELQAQAEELQMQSEELQTQQEQLQLTNKFLEEQNYLAEQESIKLKQAKQELEEYSIKLEKSSRYKSEFLANMSHELRTPLNSILILSQMLSENSEELQRTDIYEYSKVVHDAGKDLLSLIDDILDLSKVEAGKVEIFPEEVNVTELPQLMQAMFSPIADKKQLHFHATIGPDVPPVLLTDGKRLQQILKNLLSNAFKFTERGSVHMRIERATAARVKEVLRRGEETDVLAISITDTGIGIPMDKQQIIFEAFQQVDGTMNRQYSGTGLGLSICREFTRLLGGAIVVRSEVHKGSTFTLYLPNMPDEQSDMMEETIVKRELTLAEQHVASGNALEASQIEADSSISPDDRIFKGKRMLLVDDDVRNIYALITAMEMKNIKVDTASNGKQALEQLEQERYDLVLMDIMMPVMDGYDAMKAIRSQPDLQDLPVIALTAKAMKGERQRCIEAGASDYIMKPIQIQQLFSLMRVWLAK